MKTKIPKLPKEERLKLKKQFGFFRIAFYLKDLLTNISKKNISRESELMVRAARVKQLGFDRYDEYLKSDFWLKKREEYECSSLLKRCMVCWDDNYCLHHTDYSCLGQEDIRTFLPLCKSHHDKLHKFLDEYNLPYSESLAALGYSLRCDTRRYHRLTRDYQKFLLRDCFQKMGFRFELIGRPKPRSTSKMPAKIIRAERKNVIREYLFDFANMKIEGVHVMNFVLSKSDEWRKSLGRKIKLIETQLGDRSIKLELKEKKLAQ